MVFFKAQLYTHKNVGTFDTASIEMLFWQCNEAKENGDKTGLNVPIYHSAHIKNHLNPTRIIFPKLLRDYLSQTQWLPRYSFVVIIFLGFWKFHNLKRMLLQWFQ